MLFFKFGLIFCLVTLALLAIFTKKIFHTEIFIPEKPEAVWNVLMNTKEYENWNPVNVKVTGEYIQGKKVKSLFIDPKGTQLDISAEVKTIKQNSLLRQSGGIPGFLTFDHQWILTPVDGGTKVTQHEVDRGIYLWIWDSSWVEPAYAKVNQALKEYLLNQNKTIEE